MYLPVYSNVVIRQFTGNVIIINQIHCKVSANRYIGQALIFIQDYFQN